MSKVKKRKKIGIPQALLYYKYFPFWRAFFEGLGLEVVESGRSSKVLLQEGNQYAIDEICIPLKLFYGHIASLLKKKIDYLFLPRYISTSVDTYMCPKFLALPDLIRATGNNLPPIVEMSVNMKKKPFFFSALETGRSLGKSLFLTHSAYTKAISAQNLFLQAMQAGRSFDDALNAAQQRVSLFPKYPSASHKIRIALIGHGYNIHDAFINMDLLKKLKQMDVHPVVIENLPSDIFEGKTSVNRSLKNYWGNEEEILSALHYLSEERSVDGIIFLCSFCCGPDSLIDEIAMRDMKLAGFPYICVVLDEHTGQAGLITRIESFVDMVAFRKRAEELEKRC